MPAPPSRPEPHSPSETAPDRVVVVDDSPTILGLFEHLLQAPGRNVRTFSCAKDAWQDIAEGAVDVVVTDLVMPDMDGLELLHKIRTMDDPPEAIVVTGEGGIAGAVAAMQAGAYDVLQKSHDAQPVRICVDRALEYRRRRQSLRERLGELDARDAFRTVVTASAAMQAVLREAQQAAPTKATVLIAGESGTGKEVVARAIHAGSRVSGGPFVAVNCAAIPARLIESELFGHVRGAYTGADADRAGAFARANGGTILLDELGELGLDVQAKLLRVLQERRVCRVGAVAEEPLDARVIAATNADLAQLVESGRFRRDLYFRLKVVQLRLPPLRDRLEDVLPLAMHFLQRYADEYRRPTRQLTPAAQIELLGWHWPGNVRELQHVIQRGVVFCQEESLDVRHLPLELASRTGSSDGSEAISSSRDGLTVDAPPIVVPVGTRMSNVEQLAIERTLAACGGNKPQAARILGLGVRTLYRKLKESVY